MARVCFIGDSHLAALKFGLPLIGDCPALTPVFFAGSGKSMSALSLGADSLTTSDDDLARVLAVTSGGRDAIRDEYDVYLIHALELSIGVLLAMLRQRRIEGISPRWPANGTEAAFRRSAESALRETLAVKILTMLREITTAPIFLSPMPLADGQMVALRAQLVKQGHNETLARMFENLCGEIAVSLDATFIAQPAATHDIDGIGTRAAYSQQPARFAVRRPTDNKHMDGEYGAAVLRDFLKAAPTACQ